MNAPSPLFLPFPFFLFLFEIVFFASFARSRAGRSLTPQSHRSQSKAKTAYDRFACAFTPILNNITRPNMYELRYQRKKGDGKEKRKKKKEKRKKKKEKEIYCI